MKLLFTKSDLLGSLTGLILLSVPAQAQWSRRPDFPIPSHVKHLVQNFNAQEWENSNFAPPKDIKKFQELRFGMMISFGITTRNKAELSWGTIDSTHRKAPDGDALSDGHSLPREPWVHWAEDLRFEHFDAREWVRIAKASGFKYIVLLAKHHEGFHFWDTQYSDFKVTNTPFGRDYLKELIDACHEAHMPVGIYYSQRDWYNPNYEPTGFGKDGTEPGPDHQKYINYQFNVVRELMSKYGRIDIFWLDALWWGGMFHAKDWDTERLTRMVRELQPHIVINNRGSIPGDFDTPEQRMGTFQNWRPWEAAVSLEETWSYSGQKAKTSDQVIRLLVGAAINDGNLDLSIGPRWDGSFDPGEVTTMHQVGTWLSTNGQSIYATRGGPWKPHPWGGSTYSGNTAYLHVTKINSGVIEMTAIGGNPVHSIVALNGPGAGRALRYSSKGGNLRIQIPAGLRDAVDTIVKIKFHNSLVGLAPIAFVNNNPGATSDDVAMTPFDYELVFGPQLKQDLTLRTNLGTMGYVIAEAGKQTGNFGTASYIARTGVEVHPSLQVDLNVPKYVTGIEITTVPTGDILEMSFSVDGQSWDHYWQSKPGEGDGKWDIDVNSFKAGAETPGKAAKSIRFRLLSDKPTQLVVKTIKIWGKDSK